MREADRSVVALNDVCGERRVEGTFRDACLLEQHLRRRSDRRCETERIACRRWEAGQAHANQPLERRRDRQRFERVDVAVERAGDLEREERVPTRLFVNPEKCLACKRSAEPVAEQPVDGADAERPDLDALRRQDRLELRRLDSGDEPPGKQHADVPLLEPPEREGQSAPADEGSSHWTSSTATTTGSCSLSASSAPRTATASARWSTGSSDASSTSSATSSARRRGGARVGSTSSRTSSNRSPSPACASPRSASDGRGVRTRSPRALGPAPRRRARASTCRCRARLRARAQQGRPSSSLDEGAEERRAPASLPTISVIHRPETIVTQSREI